MSNIQTNIDNICADILNKIIERIDPYPVTEENIIACSKTVLFDLRLVSKKMLDHYASNHENLRDAFSFAVKILFITDCQPSTIYTFPYKLNSSAYERMMLTNAEIVSWHTPNKYFLTALKNVEFVNKLPLDDVFYKAVLIKHATKSREISIKPLNLECSVEKIIYNKKTIDKYESNINIMPIVTRYLNFSFRDGNMGPVNDFVTSIDYANKIKRKCNNNDIRSTSQDSIVEFVGAFEDSSKYLLYQLSNSRDIKQTLIFAGLCMFDRYLKELEDCLSLKRSEQASEFGPNIFCLCMCQKVIENMCMRLNASEKRFDKSRWIDFFCNDMINSLCEPKTYHATVLYYINTVHKTPKSNT